VSNIQPATRLSPEYVLLGLLYQHPLHGYQLHKQLLDEFGYIWHVSQSQTYNILRRLQDQGYISAENINQDKHPPRQLLRLTEAGTQRFTEWLDSPTKCSVHTIRVEFITRLYFLKQEHPERITQAIQAQVEEVHAGVNRLKVLRAGMQPEQIFNRLALELRISLLISILAWLNECNFKFQTDKY
jgi:DNA-binding PadR family transcriptional regulator